MTAQPENEVAPPLCGGRYRLLDVLGTGGMAKVYKSFDRRLEVYRAIKVLSPAYAAHPEIRKRFLAEARTTARLAHPNIVMAHDIGADGDRLFIVMEMLEGGSIWDRMRESGPLSPIKGLEVMQALLPALGFAHEQGVIHRDIKPGNILVSRDGTYKLADFGIARVTETEGNATRTGSLLGTPAYMAPEQWNGSKELDGRADLFAMAATLYSLLTLQTPQDLHIPESQEEQLRPIPEAIRAIIQRAVRYRASDRYATAAEMLEAINAAHRRMSGQGGQSGASWSGGEDTRGRPAAAPRGGSGPGGRGSVLPELGGADLSPQAPRDIDPSMDAEELLRRSRSSPGFSGRSTPGPYERYQTPLSGSSGPPPVVEVPELRPDLAFLGGPTTGRGTSTGPTSGRIPTPTPSLTPHGTPPPVRAPVTHPPPRDLIPPARDEEDDGGRPLPEWLHPGPRLLALIGAMLLVSVGSLVWLLVGDPEKVASPPAESAVTPESRDPVPAPTLAAPPPGTPQGRLVLECRPDCSLFVNSGPVGSGRVEMPVKAGQHAVKAGPAGARVNATVTVADGETVNFCWDSASRTRCGDGGP